jgi:hypothetical protein
LCTCHWRKQLLKVVDVCITLNPQYPFWDESQHEPLLLGICLPLLPNEYRFRPWKLKTTKFVEQFAREVHGMQSASVEMDWDILRKFLVQARGIPTLPNGVARKLLYSENK